MCLVCLLLSGLLLTTLDTRKGCVCYYLCSSEFGIQYMIDCYFVCHCCSFDVGRCSRWRRLRWLYLFVLSCVCHMYMGLSGYGFSSRYVSVCVCIWY